MENPSYVVLSGLVAQQRSLDVIANNVANADTPGFKTAHVQFGDWLLRARGAPAAEGESSIDFAQDRATWQDRAAGAFTHTGAPLDLAIGSNGYFSVSGANGVRLTRAGRFALTPDGSVVDSSGNALLDDKGQPLRLDPSSRRISVAGDGAVSTEAGLVGRIGVVDVAASGRLVAEGAHLFRAEASTTPSTSPQLIQGAIENSNVAPVLEMTQMMQVEREFQFSSQFIENEAQRQQTLIDQLGAEPQT